MSYIQNLLTSLLPVLFGHMQIKKNLGNLQTNVTKYNDKYFDCDSAVTKHVIKTKNGFKNLQKI